MSVEREEKALEVLDRIACALEALVSIKLGCQYPIPAMTEDDLDAADELDAALEPAE
jgi:hypothetical protein